jgi:hypothetical protein
MRPTGLGHGVYKDNVDYSVFCGEWCIGRIYETRTGPEHLRWFWALPFPGRPENLRTDNRAGSLEASKKVASGGAGTEQPTSATARGPRCMHYGWFEGRPC